MSVLGSKHVGGEVSKPLTESIGIIGMTSPNSLVKVETKKATCDLGRLLRLRYVQDGQQVKALATTWYNGKLTEIAWHRAQPSLIFQSGQLIRFNMAPGTPLTTDAPLQVSDVRLAANVDSDVFLIDTVPTSWLPGPKTTTKQVAETISHVEDFRNLWDNLSRPMRAWLNAVFWLQPMRLHSFLCAPASMNHHHARKHGLFIHSVDCAQRAMASAWHDEHVNTDVLMIAALLHDVGKAAEYCWNANKQCWTLSDRGALMGHRLTALEWMAAARGLLSAENSPNETEAVAVYHAINACNAPDWVGLRSPRTPEAFYLSSVDGLSGYCDLIETNAVTNAVRGRYHAQFRGGAYVTASKATYSYDLTK